MYFLEMEERYERMRIRCARAALLRRDLDRGHESMRVDQRNKRKCVDMDPNRPREQCRVYKQQVIVW